MAGPAPGALLLTDCVGMLVKAFYPGQGAPGARPDGWPPAPPALGYTTVGMQALRCQRVALGAFERGPIHLALDWHNNAQAPPACGGEDPTANIVATAWTDDPDLAAHLRDAFGLPAFASPVQEEAADLAAGRWHTWSWGLDSDPSRLSVLSSSLQQHQRPSLFRAFWADGDAAAAGVGRLELNWTATEAAADVPAQGSMRPPMLAGDFTGTGQWLGGYEASGSVTRFRDTGCREAAP
jgi:hypothetical protein